MRAFHFKAEYNQLLTPEIVAYLTQIHEYKGQQNLFIEAKADALSSLLEVARIQSTEASNRIEGIITTDDRLKKIVREKTMPQTRSFIGICTSTAVSPSAAASRIRTM